MENNDKPKESNSQWYTCPVCGGDMKGDGYKMARCCERVDPTDPDFCFEPDAAPVYCNWKETRIKPLNS